MCFDRVAAVRIIDGFPIFVIKFFFVIQTRWQCAYVFSMIDSVLIEIEIFKRVMKFIT